MPVQEEDGRTLATNPNPEGDITAFQIPDGEPVKHLMASGKQGASTG